MNVRPDGKAWCFHAWVNCTGLLKHTANRLLQIAAVAVLAIAVANHEVRAQSTVEGYIYGTAAAAAPGSSVVAVNNDTGLKREAMADSSGNFRLSALPTGSYNVTLKSPGKADQVSSNVSVPAGSGTAVNFGQTADQTLQLEKFEVKNTSISPIDMSSVESVTILRSETIDLLPVARSASQVALLAPGTSQGVNAFGNLVSFGGSSVAENSYFVNGFNLTNFRNGLGGGSVPFDFYEQFSTKTGGYSAEFGRSTGGVVDATTKSGSNTFHTGANLYWQPKTLEWRSPSVRLADGTLYTDHSVDVNFRSSSNSGDDETLTSNLWVSGPIWKNHIFYYALYSPRENETDYANIGQYVKKTSHNPFWGGKLNFNITDKQTFDFTAISDKRTENEELFDYDNTTKVIGVSNGVTAHLRGGKDLIYHYSGQFTPDFSVSALYGTGTADETDAGAGDAYPFIYDGRSGALVQLGKATQLQPSLIKDKRKAARLDFDYNFSLWGTHHLRFGYDREDNTLLNVVKYSGPGDGGQYFRYYAVTGGVTKLANGSIVPAGVSQVVRQRFYENGGNFETISDAYYITDEWKLMNDRLLLSLGLRDDEFNNRNSLGKTFIKMKGQYGPRIGVSYDVKGDHKSKLFANFGRYFMPVATNTNARLAGGETFHEDYYALTSVNTDGTPVLGAKIGGQNVFNDGTIKDPTTIVNGLIKPQYQDEYIIGYQSQVSDHWTIGVRGMSRKMVTFLEDEAIDPYLNSYAAAQGIPTSTFSAGGNDFYVLTNPGKPMTVYVDFGDGKGAQKLSITPAQQGFPAASRQYYGVELFFERIATAKWFMQGSYTWSHSYGNDEGTVLSDNGQTDNGLTELFDHPGLMDGRYGNLNNDHRHRFKLYGAYNITSEWQTGANIQIESGTPKIALGYHPTDAFAAQYGAASFYVNGVLVPRGSLGVTPWSTTLNWTVKYTPSWGQKKLSFGMDVFNVLNRHTPTEYVATAESGGQGQPFKAYGLPSIYQDPRYIRLSASYKY